MRIVLAHNNETANRIISHHRTQGPRVYPEQPWVFVELTEDEHQKVKGVADTKDGNLSSIVDVLQKAIERVVIRSDDRHIFSSDTVLVTMTDYTYAVLRDIGGKTGRIAF